MNGFQSAYRIVHSIGVKKYRSISLWPLLGGYIHTIYYINFPLIISVINTHIPKLSDYIYLPNSCHQTQTVLIMSYVSNLIICLFLVIITLLHHVELRSRWIWASPATFYGSVTLLHFKVFFTAACICYQRHFAHDNMFCSCLVDAQ